MWPFTYHAISLFFPLIFKTPVKSSYFHHIFITRSIYQWTCPHKESLLTQLQTRAQNNWTWQSMEEKKKLYWYTNSNTNFKVWLNVQILFGHYMPMIICKWSYEQKMEEKSFGECECRLKNMYHINSGILRNSASPVLSESLHTAQWKWEMAVSGPLVFGCHCDSLIGVKGVHILSFCHNRICVTIPLSTGWVTIA